jgi:hypothetical protein
MNQIISDQCGFYKHTDTFTLCITDDFMFNCLIGIILGSIICLVIGFFGDSF